ncbi:expressed protein [Phakopsora pachyrhizi]|uniref:Expressed protein n=1 Tax=Phakopsora pachyrhizi TaxID=170000 RepID=A0AAV0BQD3_PHAPC|nr:expressed protein [Phakopsora pachyrhizi]
MSLDELQVRLQSTYQQVQRSVDSWIPNHLITTNVGVKDSLIVRSNHPSRPLNRIRCSRLGLGSNSRIAQTDGQLTSRITTHQTRSTQSDGRDVKGDHPLSLEGDDELEQDSRSNIFVSNSSDLMARNRIHSSLHTQGDSVPALDNRSVRPMSFYSDSDGVGLSKNQLKKRRRLERRAATPPSTVESNQKLDPQQQKQRQEKRKKKKKKKENPPH